MADAAFAELIRRPPTREEITNAAEAATTLAQAREADGKLIIAGADGRSFTSRRRLAN